MRPRRIHSPAAPAPHLLGEVLADLGEDLVGELDQMEMINGNGRPGQPHPHLAAVLYVDGHVRAYQGRKKIGKVHSTRLKFPTPATEETWVPDSHGAPVFMVMAAPGTALTKELRTLLPTLRDIIGDERAVLVCFDRGGWSAALFHHMQGHGFDVLT
ncbi:putative transposase [Pseudarthrobacter sp. P1]|uniref:putative transposase n=1 Tax=Pseudarthrobacter sp. P1 TaxID=3418418 RepID=UPI003CE67237